ncbi:hypothetical protein HYY72_03955 [Candidatus Woesearchaeota archaeon]|nr:hypothetical protein [Candidatus Woesearchaeota archaeon]
MRRTNSAVRTALDELVQGALPTAIRKTENAYPSEESVRRNRQQILAWPCVKEATEFVKDYREAGEELVRQIAWFLINPFIQEEDAEVRHELGIDAICYAHETPVTVGKLSVSERKARQYPTIDEFLKRHKFRHSDFTYSHHAERIAEGRILCSSNHCNKAATLVPTTKIYRAVPRQENPTGIEDAIIAELAMKFFPERLRMHRHATIRHLRRDIELALGVGRTFDSIYHALEQTRFYTVNTADIMNNMAHLTRADANQLKLLTPETYDKIRRAFIDSVDELAAHYIRNPFIVVVTRMKGDSFADKYILKKHVPDINRGIRDGSLNEYLAGKGLPPIPKDKRTGKPKPFETPHLEDFVAMRAIVHGDAISYDLRTGYTLPPGESVGQTRAVMVFKHIAGINSGERIIEPQTGKLVKVDASSPFDSKGFYIDPERVDDYVNKPKPSGYRAIHVTIASTHVACRGMPIPFELQIKSNFMDNAEQRESGQHHDLKKAVQAAMVDYIVATGATSAARVEIIRTILSPNN